MLISIDMTEPQQTSRHRGDENVSIPHINFGRNDVNLTTTS